MGKLTDILNEDNGKKKESKYSQLLKDPRWQKKRLEILDRDDWKCTHCEAEHKTLHVHHRHKYVRGCTSEIEIAQHKGNEFVRVSEFDRSREVWIF